MRKLLTILGAVGLTATASTSVVACSGSKKNDSKVYNPDTTNKNDISIDAMHTFKSNVFGWWKKDGNKFGFVYDLTGYFLSLGNDNIPVWNKPIDKTKIMGFTNTNFNHHKKKYEIGEKIAFLLKTDNNEKKEFISQKNSEAVWKNQIISDDSGLWVNLE